MAFATENYTHNLLVSSLLSTGTLKQKAEQTLKNSVINSSTHPNPNLHVILSLRITLIKVITICELLQLFKSTNAVY